MFQLKKRESLSLIPAPTAALEDIFDASAGTLDESFQGWLQKATLAECEPDATNTQVKCIRPVTTQELLQVERATVRESYEHRLWPKGALAEFVAAEVITSPLRCRDRDALKCPARGGGDLQQLPGQRQDRPHQLQGWRRQRRRHHHQVANRRD